MSGRSGSRVIERAALLWALFGGVCILLIAGMMVVNALATTADMLLRGAGLRVSGIYGSEEIALLLASVAALSFFPLCHLHGGHIAVGILVDGAPAAVRDANALLGQCIALVSALFLAAWMALGTIEVWQDATTSGILGWPQWPFYVPGVVSLLLWSLVAGLGAAGEIRRMRGRGHGRA